MTAPDKPVSDQRLAELLGIVERATPGPGGFYELAIPIAESKTQVLASIALSIERSIEFDGGHPWVQVVADNPERVVADFGCGPTSFKNAELWAIARNEMALLIREIQQRRSQEAPQGKREWKADDVVGEINTDDHALGGCGCGCVPRNIAVKLNNLSPEVQDALNGRKA